MQSWKEYFNRHRSVIIGAAIGLLVGILFLTIGFSRRFFWRFSGESVL